MRLGFALYPHWQLSVDTILLTSDFRVADRNLQPAWLSFCVNDLFFLSGRLWNFIIIFGMTTFYPGICLACSFFFFFGCSFLGTQRILSVWRFKYFFSFVKIFFTYLLKYQLSSLDCFFSFSNACLCVHYNFCIYLWSSYICSVVSVLAFLLLWEIFLHLFFQASLYFSTVPYSFSASLLRSLRWSSCSWVWAMAAQLSVELGALLQPVFCWWLPAPSPPHTHTACWAHPSLPAVLITLQRPLTQQQFHEL